MARGALIFAFLAELHRLDRQALAALPPSEGGYDPDFREPGLVDRDDDGLPEPGRRELPPVRVPCQVEPQAYDALRMYGAGASPRSRVDLVFHFADLERLGLVDAATGTALIQVGDRLGGIYDVHGRLVQAVQTPPGLYATETRPLGFGLHRPAPRRNLLLAVFEERRTTSQMEGR